MGKKNTHLGALLATAKRPARSVEICLRGDLVAEIEQGTRDLALAKENDDKAAMERLASHVQSLKQEMAESIITVKLQAMPRDAWLKLLTEHPPGGEERDEMLGFNPDTMYPDMIRRSWAEPEVEQAEISQLLDILNDGQFTELAEAAFAVNTRGAVVPFGWRGYTPTAS